MLHCTYFQPMAKPQDGSRNLVEKAEKDPEMGNTTASSAKLCMVQNCMAPVSAYAVSIEAGPLWARSTPEATKRPVPKALLDFGR